MDCPVLRPDGSILVDPGYDPETCLLVPIACPVVPDRPSKDDAVRARDVFLDVVSDFPFEQEMHKSAWLAGLADAAGTLRVLRSGPAVPG